MVQCVEWISLITWATKRKGYPYRKVAILHKSVAISHNLYDRPHGRISTLLSGSMTLSNPQSRTFYFTCQVT